MIPQKFPGAVEPIRTITERQLSAALSDAWMQDYPPHAVVVPAPSK
jgi:hypothetical protein